MKIKKDLSTPISIKNIPKVELHRHLDCSWRYSTLLELAGNSEDPGQYFVSEPMSDLESVLKKFERAQKFLKSTDILERLAFETIEDAFNDGVRILELRYSLQFIQDISNLSFEKIHQSFLIGINKALKKYPMATGLISILQRNKNKTDLEKILDFTLQNRDTFIGVDLADNELHFNASDYEYLFNRAHDQGMPITIHSGEVPYPLSAQSIKDSVTKLHAQRIGHGIQLLSSSEIMNEMISKKIHFEICPISNVLTNSFLNLKRHPFYEFYQKGLMLSINSDDPGIFNTRLSDDYSWLIQQFSMTSSDFYTINSMAAQASFISPEIKEVYWPY